MARGLAIQSVDLALTRYSGVPSYAPLESADSWGSLDLQLTGRQRSRTSVVEDFGVVGERANLAQALMLRLLTEQGALTELGHPAYGSKLVTLIGQLNNQITRNLARLYVIDAIRQEARVKTLSALSVETVTGQPDSIRISLTVIPLHDDDPLALGLDIAL
jgi:phage baseplate assembly protein W